MSRLRLIRIAGSIDEQTGRRTGVRAGRGCSPAAVGGEYALFSCGLGDPAEVKLYRLAAPQGWRSAPSPAAIARTCTSGYQQCVPIAVGNDWIEYDGQVCQDGEHCVDYYEFENIATGQVANDPATPGGTRYPDLSAGGLARRLCSPLHVPTSFSAAGTQEPGILTFYGKVAIAESDDVQGDGPSTSLERCGSARTQLLQSAQQDLAPAVGSASAVVWMSKPPRISGISLPSERRFALTIPNYIHFARSGAQLAVTSTSVFVIGDGTLWARSLPDTIPSHHSNRTTGR